MLATYPTPESQAQADSDSIAVVIESLGFQNQRAHALIENERTIADDGVPDTLAGLKELSYVGNYAANAILCFGF